ncbi:hypothetical protein [Streptomyces coelicoflavus]|nr:hypothetical protein [Streptomyces coelicoflavus]EHN80097.1 secreted protein [Streptomyces coelicoflavus ZG0656]MZE46530.1 hypothetical protein [Streptomyces sp. SID5477]
MYGGTNGRAARTRWRAAEGAGGFSLGVRNDGAEQRWPRFTSLEVE